VAQVALSVAVVPTAVELAWNILRPAILGPGFPVNEFLTARLDLNDAGKDPAGAAARFSTLRTELVRQLRAEPGITAVTMSESKPFEERGMDVEADSSGSAQGPQSVAFNQVDSAFFDVFGIRLLAGRGFEPVDNDPQRGTILVNRSFANRVFAGESPLGRTVRVDGRNAPATRYEIVGLVDNQFAYSDQATIYRPLTQGRTLKEVKEAAGFVAAREAGEVLSVHLAIHMGPAVSPDFASRLSEITAAIAPALRVDDVQPLNEIYFFLSLPTYIMGSLPALVALGVLLFATAGIYTRMSFAVVQRRREIGIRSALGASPQRLVAGIFRSVLVPVSAGVALGGLTALLLDFYLSPVLPFGAEGGPRLPWILPAAEAFVLLMGVIALLGPVRRTLQVDAVEALREG
jgi:ABC-type antimicrobial peptide transport system permease subunit